MATLTILRGVSGAGKSTLADKMADESTAETVAICSADDYFVNAAGEYNFDPSKLSEAHRQCFVNVDNNLEHGWDVIVDNTNCSLFEVSPYLMLGQKHRAEVRIIRIECDPSIAASRNIHGVPTKVVKMMDQRMERALPFWPKEEILQSE